MHLLFFGLRRFVHLARRVRANARNDGYHIKSMNLAMRRQQSCIQFTLRINTKTGKGST